MPTIKTPRFQITAFCNYRLTFPNVKNHFRLRQNAFVTILTEKSLKNSSEGLDFNGKSDIVLEMRLSGATKQI
jgi:hypothetical protein